MKLPRGKRVDQTILNMELRIDVSYTKHRVTEARDCDEAQGNWENRWQVLKGRHDLSFQSKTWNLKIFTYKVVIQNDKKKKITIAIKQFHPEWRKMVCRQRISLSTNHFPPFRMKLFNCYCYFFFLSFCITTL